jgi:hypothetical protein
MWNDAKNRYVGLSDAKRIEFLALLHFRLSEVARACYVEAGNDETSAIKGLRAHNEMIQVTSKQLLVALGLWKPDSAYPHDIFLDILAGKAKQGNCQDGLVWAVSESLKNFAIR